MTVLVVGADHLGSIPKKLREEGAHKIVHWTGRRASFQNKRIPQRIQKVVICCDYINHKLMDNVKRQAKSSGIPVVYSRRNTSSMFGNTD
ncbi:MAG: DUF2325 domain-containing protein [Firmicutes bacterium]|nr:DUF2325 domain-containing protein [Bacillota bacterium]